MTVFFRWDKSRQAWFWFFETLPWLTPAEVDGLSPPPLRISDPEEGKDSPRDKRQ